MSKYTAEADIKEIGKFIGITKSCLFIETAKDEICTKFCI